MATISAASLTIPVLKDTPTPYNDFCAIRHGVASEMTPAMKIKHVRPGLEKRALIVRLRRIKGQIEALEKMVEAGNETSDVLMQVVAARRALKSFSEELIGSHLHECLENASSPSESRRELQSLMTVLKRYAI